MKKLKTILKEILREDCVDEAIEILANSSKEGVEEFYKYYNEKKHNICCMHLDYLKCKLIKEGKMKDDGCFGFPF